MNEQSDDDGQQTGSHGTDAPILSTMRLILRAPAMEDAKAIAEIANNRRIAEQTRRMPHPYSERDAVEWIEKGAASGDSSFLVTLKSDGTIIGAAGFAPMDEDETEIGYWIGEHFWGNGYATEAAQAVIDHAFTALPLERLYGCCRVTNTPSRRVLVKCGFQLVGPGMCDCRALKGVVPAEEFILERSVWASLRQWGEA